MAKFDLPALLLEGLVALGGGQRLADGTLPFGVEPLDPGLAPVDRFGELPLELSPAFKVRPGLIGRTARLLQFPLHLLVLGSSQPVVLLRLGQETALEVDSFLDHLQLAPQAGDLLLEKRAAILIACLLVRHLVLAGGERLALLLKKGQLLPDPLDLNVETARLLPCLVQRALG